MSRIILDLAVTLDGFIEGPNGEIDWLEGHDLDFADILTDILDGIDAIFYGRVSYEKWGHYHPGDTYGPKLKAAYDMLHSKKKYVFSHHMPEDGKATFIRGNIQQEVEQVLGRTKGNIWLYGGGKLITTFLNLGLIDVFRMAVHPVILGQGKPLFENIRGRTDLHLDEVKTWTSGILLLKYSAIRR